MKNIFKKIIVFVLTFEARLVLWKYKPHIIAITGNVGKTSTKDAVCSLLRAHTNTWCSKKSFNSEIGVPLTILGAENAWSSVFGWFLVCVRGFSLFFFSHEYPSFLVLEVGADRPGDIARIAPIIKPDVVVLTAFGEVPVHIEFFKSQEELVAEKGKLAASLKKDGVLIINFDDPDAYRFAEQSKEFGLKKERVITFGLKDGADAKGSEFHIVYGKDTTPRGVSFVARYGKFSVLVFVKDTLGMQSVYSIRPAVALGVYYNMPVKKIQAVFKVFHVPPGRLRILKGVRGSLILDDSYNASPKAIEAALVALQAVVVPGRKIAVLGDMLELGKHSVEAHQHVGRIARGVCDALLTVGVRARRIGEEAVCLGMSTDVVRQFTTSLEAGNFLKSFVKEGDVVLIKGSQSMRMEKIVEALLSDSRDRIHLVRQEAAWKLR